MFSVFRLATMDGKQFLPRPKPYMNPPKSQTAEQEEASVYEPHGPWQIVQRNSMYEDPWMHVRMDNVIRPDGLAGTYSTVRIKPGVCVIPVDSNGSVYLTREFHYAVGRDTIEGISGGIETGESSEIAAQRELLEEVGIVAGKLHFIGTVDPLTAALWSPTSLFLATDLTLTTPNPESTEKIERVAMPFGRAVRMVMDSEITHAPTCTAILKIQILLHENSLKSGI